MFTPTVPAQGALGQPGQPGQHGKGGQQGQQPLPPSMIIEIPPTHAAWRAHWTEEDDAEYRENINNQRRARQTMKDTDPGSASYWEAAKLDNKMAIACNDLKWRLCRKVYRNDVRRSEYLWMHKAWKSHRAALEDKRDDIEKMAVRVQNRDSLLGFMKMEGVTPMMHSFEIMDALVTMAEKADPKGLEALAQNMKVAYGTMTTAGGTELVWSPLEGDWRMQYELRPTHILPFCFSSTTFGYLFKHMQGKREINSADNGLFLPPPVEEALYNHHVSFIPVPVEELHTGTSMEIDGTGPAPAEAMEYRLIVVDKAQVWNLLAARATPFSDMHGRKLRFLKNCRPLDQYIYVHYLMSVLTLARKLRVGANQNPGKPQDLMAVPELLKMWPNEKTRFGKNIDGLFQSVLKGVRQNLQTLNSGGGQIGQGGIGKNPPASMFHSTDPGFHMQLNWFATLHREGEEHD